MNDCPFFYKYTKKPPDMRAASFALSSHALDFLDLGSLTLQVAQIVQLSAANLTTTDHFDVVQTGRMQRERAFYANAVGHAGEP